MMDFGKFVSTSSQAALRSFDGLVERMEFLRKKTFILLCNHCRPISKRFSLFCSTSPSLQIPKWSPKPSLVTISCANHLILLSKGVETRSIIIAIHATSVMSVWWNWLVLTPLFILLSPQVHQTSSALWSLFGHRVQLGPNTLKCMQCMQLALKERP